MKGEMVRAPWNALACRLAGHAVPADGAEEMDILDGWQFMGADQRGACFRLRAGYRDDYRSGPHRYEFVKV